MSKNQNKGHNYHSKSFNISLDVKNFSKNSSQASPIQKKSNAQLLSQKQIKNPIKINHPSFHYAPSQNNIFTKKRRFSLSKGIKACNSVSIDNHFFEIKYSKVQHLIKACRYYEVIPILQSLLSYPCEPSIKMEIYFWLCIAYNKTNNISQAIQIISEGIHQYPNFQDGILYRGKLFCKLKKYKQAIGDYELVLSKNANNYLIYLQLGECYEFINNRQAAIKIWNKGKKVGVKQQLFSIKIVQTFLKEGKITECEDQMKLLRQKLHTKSSERHYLEGILEKAKKNYNQACIFFEESIKYNNSQIYINLSLYELLKIKIQQRDYYSAYHSLTRLPKETHLQYLLCFSQFLQGALHLIKKKYQDGVQILNRTLARKKTIDPFLIPFYYKFLGYAYFKMGRHSQALRQYGRLPKSQIDKVTLYNQTLAQGIVEVDTENNYKVGIEKFNQAKILFPQKVQPFNYVAMSIIKEVLSRKNISQQTQVLSILKAIDQLNLGEQINSSNSNLLFHRTIIYMHLENWDQAIDDINHCIEKAQENLPKYFYLRGICYAATKQLVKAINEQSICISLNSEYSEAYLQRAKNSFLVGDTESGFKDLKIYMNYHPNDIKVHKWIGDLLYEGKSYKDALRAYEEVGDKMGQNLLQMKAKCQFRAGSLSDVVQSLKNLEKYIQNGDVSNNKTLQVDKCAIKLLNVLIKGEANNLINQNMKVLNGLLEDGKIGYIFQLIDCMNLMGVSAFYLAKYDDAYESFALVLQLFQSLESRIGADLKSQCSQQNLNLSVDKIIFHMFLCQVLRGERNKAVNLLNDSQVMKNYIEYEFGKEILKIVEGLKDQKESLIVLDPNPAQSIFRKMRKVEVRVYKLRIQTKLFFGLFHEPAGDLYSTQFARQFIYRLKPSYLEDMPQAPWIKRNQHGVIFTDDVIIQENSELFDSFVSSPAEQPQKHSTALSKRQQFLKTLRLEKSVEDKLNNFLNKQNH